MSGATLRLRVEELNQNPLTATNEVNHNRVDDLIRSNHPTTQKTAVIQAQFTAGTCAGDDGRTESSKHLWKISAWNSPSCR